MDVNIGKGITISVDTASLPEAAMAHVVYIGLKNILQDAHAGEGNPDLARADAEKKLAALMSGQVRVNTGREGDPVKARAKMIATGHAKKQWVGQGRKLRDMTTDDLNTMVQKLLEKNPSIMAQAAAAVAAEAAITIEM
jgi:hypothetical protein